MSASQNSSFFFQIINIDVYSGQVSLKAPWLRRFFTLNGISVAIRFIDYLLSIKVAARFVEIDSYGEWPPGCGPEQWQTLAQISWLLVRWMIQIYIC